MQLKTWGRQWLRHNWPARPAHAPRSHRAAVVVVNFNTAELLSHLLFSLFRILDREQLARVVVVDNASTDLSKPLLVALRDAGLVDVLLNEHQQYHGPGLNQGMDHLAAIRQSGAASATDFDYVWILDSDTVVLRPDALRASVAFLEAQRAALIGQHQPHKGMPEGYAHVSALLVDPVQVWRRGIAPFEEAGTPAEALQISLRRRGGAIRDFPCRSHNYILHLGRGTLAQIKETQDQSNRYYGWAAQHSQTHFHGNPDGAQIHQQFLAAFRAEVPELNPQSLTAACQRAERVRLNLPAPPPHAAA